VKCTLRKSLNFARENRNAGRTEKWKFSVPFRRLCDNENMINMAICRRGN
jgi:hypothetical protein